MLFKQFLNDDLGCACYLVGDEHEGVAVVVDPPYHVEPVLAEAERREVRLVGVLETHTHADHVSGHGRLALEHGLPIRVHRDAGATFPHEPLDDGTEVEVGEVVLRTIHTPGHRPEHCCFAVIDRSRSDEPWLVLTGDSLFVGDAGRPDLAVEAQEGAEGLFHSLRRLVELGDGVEVFPGHVAGSLCGAAMSSKASTTIGFERRSNPALQGELADFLAARLGPQPPRPPNMERIVELNRGELLGAQPPLERADSIPDEAIVLDVRPTEAFAAGHHPGAVGIPVSGSSFATKAGFVLPERPLVLHARTRSEAGSRRAGAAGRRAVRGLRLAGRRRHREARAGLARGARAPARRRRGRAARRARGRRARRRAHPRLAASPLPDGASRRGGGTAQRPPGGDDLRVRPARGGRRERAAGRRRERTPGARRRCRRLARSRRRDDVVPPLRR